MSREQWLLVALLVLGVLIGVLLVLLVSVGPAEPPL